LNLACKWYLVFQFGLQDELITFNVAAEAYAYICVGLMHVIALMLKLVMSNRFPNIINEDSATPRVGSSLEIL